MAIKELRSDQSRIILMVDKGIAMVVMDRQDYNTKRLELLDDKDTYRPISEDPTTKYKGKLINILKSCKAQGQINHDISKKLDPTCAYNPNSLAYPKSTKQAPPKVHSIQQGCDNIWSS